MGLLQTTVAAIYPPRCLGCGVMVDSDFGLCGTCWAKAEFIGGAACNSCGVALPGVADGTAVECDDCMASPPPWDQGRAALIYGGMGRKLILGLKHGDRQEVARPAARWLYTAVKPMLSDHMLIAPVPLHWMRLAKRRYNQSALLARALADETGLSWCPDLLSRRRRTPSLDGRSRTERERILDGSITVNPKRQHMIAARPVLLVDDVMTTGATLGAATRAVRAAGAARVCVGVLARATKNT